MATLEQALKEFNNSDWGAWQKAKNCSFKKDDVFVLDLYGDDPTSEEIFIAKSDIRSSDRSVSMSKWKWGGQNWDNGHEWLMTGDSRVRFFKETISPSNNGCVCHRCNARNEYAAPNQKDGTYICFECRS